MTFWAIGARETEPVENRLIHWDGSTWDEERPPADVSYSSVDGSASDDLWLVGTVWLNNGNVPSPYLAHWDGVRWTRVPAPEVPDNVALEDVAVHSSTAAWAVGMSLTTRTENPGHRSFCAGTGRHGKRCPPLNPKAISTTSAWTTSR